MIIGRNGLRQSVLVRFLICNIWMQVKRDLQREDKREQSGELQMFLESWQLVVVEVYEGDIQLEVDIEKVYFWI